MLQYLGNRTASLCPSMDDISDAKHGRGEVHAPVCAATRRDSAFRWEAVVTSEDLDEDLVGQGMSKNSGKR